MLFLLYGQTKTPKWNGLPLHETLSAEVEETLNGNFTLQFDYPITDSGIYKELVTDKLILCPVPYANKQLFRIKKPIEENDRVRVTCQHITDDIMRRSILPVSNQNVTCQSALGQLISKAKRDIAPFSFDSDITKKRSFNTTETATLYQVLMDGKHSILGTWEGELVRDNFLFTIKEHRGKNRGVVISTHHNLEKFERTRSSQSLVTRIYASSTYKPEGEKEEKTLTVMVESPLIHQYPYVYEADYENNTLHTEEELRQWAMAKFTNDHLDKVSEVIEIEAFELDGQEVQLGDEVTLKSRLHQADVVKKVVAYRFNALTEKIISISFDDTVSFGGQGVSGNSISSVANALLTLNDGKIQRQIERERANLSRVLDFNMSRVNKDVEDGIERAKAEAIRSGNQAAVDYLSSEAAEIRFAAIQKAKIDELTVSNSAWMRRLVSHQVLTEYLNAIEVSANKVVIPGSHKPVFSLDSNGNFSIDTPLLKVRGEELATKSQLSELSLTPGPKGDKGVSISQIEEYYLASNQKTGVITSTSGWSKTIPVLTDTSKYLWNYKRTVFTDGNETSTTPVVIGVYGNKGDTGQTLYTWKMYADSEKGEGISPSPKGKRYFGLAVNRPTATPSTNPSDYTWSSFFEGTVLGGRNYIDDYAMREASFTNLQSEWRKEIVEDSTSVSGISIKMTCTKAGSGGFKRDFFDLRTRIGQTMTFSVELKASKAVSMMIGSELGGTKPVSLTANWERVVSSWKVSSNSTWSFVFTLSSGVWAQGDVVWLRNVQLEDGNVATAPGPSLADLMKQIDGKADQRFMKQQLDILTEKTESIRVDMEARALASEVSDWLKTYKEFEKSNKETLTKFNQDFVANTQRIAAIEADLKSNALLLQFVNTYLRAGDNGVIIGKKDNSEFIELTPQGMMIKSAGNAVMTVTSGVIKIHHGVFVETLQVGYYRLEATRHNAKDLVCRFIDSKT